MPQRPEDYQSTKNVGGDKPGGTDARTNDPFSYLKQQVKPEHSYLGHFKQEKFLRDGHNRTVARTGLPSFENLRARGARRMLRSSATTDLVKTQIAAERPVAAARVARREAIQAARSGPSGAAGTTRNAVRLARQEGRAAIRAARQSPESARMERRARRQARY